MLPETRLNALGAPFWRRPGGRRFSHHQQGHRKPGASRRCCRRSKPECPGQPATHADLWIRANHLPSANAFSHGRGQQHHPCADIKRRHCPRKPTIRQYKSLISSVPIPDLRQFRRNTVPRSDHFLSSSQLNAATTNTPARRMRNSRAHRSGGRGPRSPVAVRRGR